MTTKTISDWLSTTIASDLSVTCKLGYPAFDRPDIAAGAYLRFRQSDPIIGERVSATVDRFTRAFDVMVITASEVALLAKIDLMEAMVIARTAATISGTNRKIAWDTIERADNPYETEAMRYAAQTTVFVR
ncbi:MAG: hypothetical protein KDI12_16350 [Anaerolineae bacterium]|nr:hypothetical protein [Anaerolineae bacterium]